jgi:hypothetical protein
MLEFIFTLDYEIYGNGEGSLRTLVYDPAKRLKDVFDKWKACPVIFVEAAALEMIEAYEADPAMILVKDQIRDFLDSDYEIGLHIHPQWYNAHYEDGKWRPDYSEYNLCRLAEERIVEIVDRSITYLRKLSGATGFCPLSFRAGNWLFQPTRTLAKALINRGIMIDSSVFKGGVQHQHDLDYRRALKNGYYWQFSDDVNVTDTQGPLVEMPIYTKMVPIWKMLTKKRVDLQRKSYKKTVVVKQKFSRLRDLIRFRYPLKLDFCRMAMGELIELLDAEINRDNDNPHIFRPIVAIGHTKDLIDIETVESLLSYLGENGIKISTFRDVYPKVKVPMEHKINVE